MSRDEISSVIAKLSAEYAEQLQGKVARMEQLWRQLVAEQMPSSQLDELVRMAHGIAGSGATFGLPSASRVARELEAFLDHFMVSKRFPSPAEQASVSALLTALRQAAVQR